MFYHNEEGREQSEIKNAEMKLRPSDMTKQISICQNKEFLN